MLRDGLAGLFRDETRRRLATIEGLLTRLEDGARLRVDVPAALPSELYREAHTIKGGAALVRLDQAQAAATVLEGIFRDLRDGKVAPLVAIRRAHTQLAELGRVCAAIEQEAAVAPDLAARDAQEVDQESRPSVLYIEDDHANRLLVERLFAQRPALRLVVATDGTAGLRRARTEIPRLILLDLNLPDMRGDEVLAALLEDATTRAIPVVVMSAEPAGTHADRLVTSGAAGYLEKPLDLRLVLSIVDEHLPVSS